MLRYLVTRVLHRSVDKVATRWNTTVEGAMEVEKELQLDRSIYDELRARRDFGFEQVCRP